ncbi:MAG: polyprenyl synthetase family protein [Bacteroidetes bacterium]|nr:polyprenyl synthetase family protein [Bacteroidota bacterium]
MSASIEPIKKPIASELDRFEREFRQSMKTAVPLLDTIMTYIVRRKGKQVRPLFVLYSAQLFGEINDRTYRGASLVELLHTATLVHDDVVDDSFQRRGFFSINALWKNKIAVLVGDYLLSRGLLLSVQNKDFDMLEILSDSVREMSEGELLQLERARNMSATEEVYFEIIRKKTASLISSCCHIGAISTTQDPETLKAMARFGECLGLAFQIRDDLFDFGDNKSGKPAGLDIKEKKLTLPIIYALQKAPKSEGKAIKKLIRSKKSDAEKISGVLQFVEQFGGMEYARKKMNALRSEAFEILRHLETNPSASQHLEALVNFIIDRNS